MKLRKLRKLSLAWLAHIHTAAAGDTKLWNRALKKPAKGIS